MEDGSFLSSKTNSINKDLWVDLCPGKRSEDMLVLACLPSEPFPTLFPLRLLLFLLSPSGSDA